MRLQQGDGGEAELQVARAGGKRFGPSRRAGPAVDQRLARSAPAAAARSPAAGRGSMLITPRSVANHSRPSRPFQAPGWRLRVAADLAPAIGGLERDSDRPAARSPLQRRPVDAEQAAAGARPTGGRGRRQHLEQIGRRPAPSGPSRMRQTPSRRRTRPSWSASQSVPSRSRCRDAHRARGRVRACDRAPAARRRPGTAARSPRHPQHALVVVLHARISPSGSPSRRPPATPGQPLAVVAGQPVRSADPQRAVGVDVQRGHRTSPAAGRSIFAVAPAGQAASVPTQTSPPGPGHTAARPRRAGRRPG